MKKLALTMFAASILPFTMPSLAHAEVKSLAENGFVVIHNAEVTATPDEIWKRLIAPKDWWKKEHSWSGSSEGFYIDAQANGCFCELFQEEQKDGKLKTVGSVEHMRVIFAQPGKVLRMQGALGPLQSEAVTGTFTVAIAQEPGGDSTKLSFSYVVGGYMRYKASEIAPAVDKVLGEQFKALIEPFGKPEDIEDKPSSWSLDLEGLIDDKPDKKTGEEEEKKDADAAKPEINDEPKANSVKKER